MLVPLPAPLDAGTSGLAIIPREPGRTVATTPEPGMIDPEIPPVTGLAMVLSAPGIALATMPLAAFVSTARLWGIVPVTAAKAEETARAVGLTSVATAPVNAPVTDPTLSETAPVADRTGAATVEAMPVAVRVRGASAPETARVTRDTVFTSAPVAELMTGAARFETAPVTGAVRFETALAIGIAALETAAVTGAATFEMTPDTGAVTRDTGAVTLETTAVIGSTRWETALATGIAVFEIVPVTGAAALETASAAPVAPRAVTSGTVPAASEMTDATAFEPFPPTPATGVATIEPVPNAPFVIGDPISDELSATAPVTVVAGLETVCAPGGTASGTADEAWLTGPGSSDVSSSTDVGTGTDDCGADGAELLTVDATGADSLKADDWTVGATFVAAACAVEGAGAETFDADG
jgi:hypothetical protein